MAPAREAGFGGDAGEGRGFGGGRVVLVLHARAVKNPWAQLLDSAALLQTCSENLSLEIYSAVSLSIHSFPEQKKVYLFIQ